MCVRVAVLYIMHAIYHDLLLKRDLTAGRADITTHIPIIQYSNFM